MYPGDGSMETSHHTHPRFQISYYQPRSMLLRLIYGDSSRTAFSRLPYFFSSLVLAWVWSTSSPTSGAWKNTNCSSRGTALLQTLHIVTVARSMMVTSATHGEYPQGQPFPLQEVPSCTSHPVLQDDHRVPFPSKSWGCLWS